MAAFKDNTSREVMTGISLNHDLNGQSQKPSDVERVILGYVRFQSASERKG